MKTSEAIDLVARQILAAIVSNCEEWESYPEIGENDWIAVVERLDQLAPFPDVIEYGKAYATLEARAED